MRRGIALSTLGRIILGLLVVLVVLVLLWFFRGPAEDVVGWILDALRFGL